jgi:hypothetical protein
MIEELKTDLATVDGSAMVVHTGLLATVHDGSPGESRMGLLATVHDGSPGDCPRWSPGDDVSWRRSSMSPGDGPRHDSQRRSSKSPGDGPRRLLATVLDVSWRRSTTGLSATVLDVSWKRSTPGLLLATHGPRQVSWQKSTKVSSW